MLKHELRNLKLHPFLILVLFASIVIAIVYTAVFVGSMWEPYEKLSNLPVAIVNEDVAADYNGESITIGKELVDSLKEEDSLAYNFVEEDVAKEGLENGTYYMIITIPKNFSTNATTVLEEEPKKMELQYEVNPGTNYIASKMTHSAAVTIQDSIKKNITEMYTEIVFESISHIKDGLEEAADGSADLYEGTINLSKGMNNLTGSTNNILLGTKELKTGTNNLASGAKDLASATEKVNSGVETLRSGSVKLIAGFVGDSGIVAGATFLEDGAKKLNKAISEISISNIELSEEQKSQITSTISSSNDITEAASQLSSGIGTSVSASVTSMLNSNETKMAISNTVIQDANIQQAISLLVSTGFYTPEQAENLFTGTVDSTLDTVSANITVDSITNAISPSVSSSITQVASASALEGIDTVLNEVDKILNNYQKQFTQLKISTASLYTGSSNLLTGIKNLYDGTVTLDNGLQTLKEGTSSLKTGTSALSNGANELDNGTESLVSGVEELNEGAVVLQDGASQLSNGALQLSDSLENGTNEIDEVSNTDDKNYNMIASPVELDKSVLHDVENNGSSISPYMMAVALWLVATVFCIGYPTRKHFGETKNGVSWWLAKLPFYTAVSIISSVVLVFGMKAIWGLQVENLGDTVLFACLVSLTFLSLYYMVYFAIGISGGYFMTIFLVVQLAGCAGTYPLELSGKFYQIIHPYLPFTYAVDGFRKTLFTGLGIGKECAIMGGIIIICNLLLIICMEKKLANEK